MHVIDFIVEDLVIFYRTVITQFFLFDNLFHSDVCHNILQCDIKRENSSIQITYFLPACASLATVITMNGNANEI